MNKEKKKKLEAKGWRFGSAADFLELSPEDATYIELRLRLVDALKSRRKAEFSQVEFATAMGSSQSRVAKIEANDPTVSLDLIIKGLIALKVSLPELGEILVRDAAQSAHRSVVRATRSAAPLLRAKKDPQVQRSAQKSKTSKKR
ncbi:MAG TPA: helix-turn-helix transcriptional regulator [Pyrinomonadaceae bacterium]